MRARPLDLLARLRRAAPVLGVLLAGALAPALALLAARGHMLMLPPAAHLAGAGVAGGLALGAAVALSVLAARAHDGRGVLLGFAFSVMATILAVHGLSTPGVLVGQNGLVGPAAVLSLPVGGAILAASALPSLRRPRDVRRLLLLELATLGVLAAAGAAGLTMPGLVPVLPRPEGAPAAAILLLCTALLGVLAWRAARTFILTRRPGDAMVAAGAVWLAFAELGLLTFPMMDLGWWIAHGLEVAGIGMIGIPAAIDLGRGARASRPLVGDLQAHELVRDEERFLGARVHALMLQLAVKDGSTAGHTRRVATLAVRMGEQLGLPAARLRLLALGGLLHDMGKLTVPDEVLNKPGRLTDEEFAVIRRHPGWGRDLLRELGGFAPLVHQLVEGHHERLDGTGYPHGRPAGELDLEVRILSVADVYDALTADRVYREAWPVERALALLDEETGSAFDAACVRALQSVLAVEGAAEAPAGPAWVATVQAEVAAAPAPVPPRRSLH